MTQKKLPSTWEPRDYPVLMEVARRFETGESKPHASAVAESLHMSIEEVSQAARALKLRGLVDYLGTAEGHVLRFRNLSGDAYLMTGLHPDPAEAVSALITALNERAARANDPDERSKLQRAAAALGALGQDVLANVLSAVLLGKTGLA